MNMPLWLRRLLRALFSDFRILEMEAKLAFIDPLTGLYNRRGMEARLADVVHLLGRSLRLNNEQRRNPMIGMVFIDVDDFGQKNKALGHDVGDRILQELGQRLMATLRHRPSDIICRWGGEEIAVFLPGADATAADDKAQAIVGLVNALPFQTTDGNYVTVTVSAGSSSMAVYGFKDEFRTVLKTLQPQADRALKMAKKLGKDQACKFEHHLPHIGNNQE